MQLIRLVSLLLSIFCVIAHAAQYSAEDLEIFAVQSKLVEDSKRTDYDFYKFLRLPDGASSDAKTIEKHYRNLSRKWHPDKYRDAKTKHRAEKRFQKLSLIITILRDHEKKQRYDYYLKKGFPQYDKATGQFIFGKRFKPNLILTLSIIVIVASLLQYLVLKVNHNRSYKRVDRLISEIRSKSLPAVGNQDTPDFGNKLVLLNDKLFVVKVDRSIWYYSGSFDTEDDLNEVVANLRKAYKIDADPSAHANRRQRRAVTKRSKDDQEDQDSIPLLPVTTDDLEPVRVSSLLIVKLLMLPSLLVHKFISTKKCLDKHPEISSKINLIQEKNDKVKLPNGKVAYKKHK
ncbi:hypothetical protein FOA43_000234 [Brettanomyces nanus]|uniref:J domain-containing protein n=1 Tax=Eeniella nana TaxID=13502 RepID=A0A875RMY8_EENNA|nr:uncharacterized protein FOA43_000234 [Brettanomyces nanus]QPG72930.1 hypothetical protein FOA43_000234 [Brettanomyces nanus]